MTKESIKDLLRPIIADKLRDDEFRRDAKTKLLQKLPDPRPADCLIDECIEELTVKVAESLFRM